MQHSIKAHRMFGPHRPCARQQAKHEVGIQSWSRIKILLMDVGWMRIPCHCPRGHSMPSPSLDHCAGLFGRLLETKVPRVRVLAGFRQLSGAE